MKTSNQFLQGAVFKVRCNYILGAYQCLLYLVGIRYMRNYSSDHFSLWV